MSRLPRISQEKAKALKREEKVCGSALATCIEWVQRGMHVGGTSSCHGICVVYLGGIDCAFSVILLAF